ncbi:MAG: DnaJ domain-containing protein [Acidobacteriota bacterium]
MAKNYYAILGISQHATDQQIRERFRAMAREKHPDRYQGEEKAQAETDFQDLTEALNVLTNPERRRLHDQEIARPESQDQQGVDAEQLAKVYLQRGVKSYREKNYLQAADNFDRATKAEPGNALGWYNLALACSHQQRWTSRALEAIARACELAPMNVNYLKTAGRLHRQSGRATQALQYYEQALTWGGDDDTVRQQVEELRQGKKAKGGLFGRGS